MFHCFSSRLSKAWMECFRVKKNMLLPWFPPLIHPSRPCSGMNWCWWMLLLQKSVTFQKQLTAALGIEMRAVWLGDQIGGKSRSSSTVFPTHYIKSWWFVKPRRSGQTSGESWLLFFGDDSIVAQVMMWLWTMMAKWGAIPSRTSFANVASKQSVDDFYSRKRWGDSVDAELRVLLY